MLCGCVCNKTIKACNGLSQDRQSNTLSSPYVKYRNPPSPYVPSNCFIYTSEKWIDPGVESS